jgi:DNA mismatch repair protein MutS
MSSSVEEKAKLTPMMEQWHRCKEEAKDAILFFRMGDFYEAFYEDAGTVAEVLELTLTQRQGIPMSGVPWHTCESYIDKLVSKGYKVAIAEQTEDPRKAKGLVNREIVRVVTPGTLISSSLLGDKSHNYIVSINQVGAIFGFAACDITTATLRTVEVDSAHELLNEIFRVQPSEIVVSKKFSEKHAQFLKECGSIPVTLIEEWKFDHQTASSFLTTHFKLSHLDGFGLKGMVAAINAAGAILSYIQDDLSLSIEHIRMIRPYFITDNLLLDRTSQLHLELTKSFQGSSKEANLLAVVDHTQTPMGGRLLREWLTKPLLDAKEILKRQDAIGALLENFSECLELQKELHQVRDLERLMMKICSHFATPRDLAVFKRSLEKMGPIKAIARKIGSELFFYCSEKITELPQLCRELNQALVDEPPVRISEGKIIRDNFDASLDELREIARGGKEWLSKYQTIVKQETGIKNLKVTYNKIFGYSIEVSKGQAHLMPSSFERRQTLVNCERFISPALKEYESKVLMAEEKILELEQESFRDSERARCYRCAFFTSPSRKKISILPSKS